MNPAEENEKPVASIPKTPEAGDTSPVSQRPDPTLGAELDESGMRFGPPAAAGEIGMLGRFRIKKELGRGGMGAVYLALDTRLERQIALKVMLPKAAANQSAKERFIREARSAARITHDNVIGILDADEIDGIPFIALPFLQGYPLDQYLKKKGNPSFAQVLKIGREMAMGLAAAHELGIVHRDIKPGNVWLEAPNGRVKILDFGLAKPQDDENSSRELTHSGAIMGTPAYMAPEQAAGHKCDHRADLYSLGTVLYRLVAGRTPFEHASGMMGLLTALAIEAPQRVESLNPSVPPALAELIHQLLEKNRDLRPQSAKEVAERLIAIRENPKAPMVSMPTPMDYVPIPITMSPQSNAFADLDASSVTEREPRKREKTEKVPLVAGGNKVIIFFMVMILVFGGGLAGLVQLLSPPREKPVPEVVEKKPDEPKPKKEYKPQPRVNPVSEPPVIKYTQWTPVTEFTEPAKPMRSAYDDLDPAKIPERERIAGQPKELVAVVGSHFNGSGVFQLSADGRFVCVQTPYYQVLYEIPTLRMKWVIACGSVIPTVLSPDGKYLACSRADPGLRGVVLWDLSESPPAEKYQLARGFDESVVYTAVAFSPDHKQIITGRQTTGTINIWNIQSTNDLPVLTIQPPIEGTVTQVAMSASGSAVAALQNRDGDTPQILVWSIADGKATLRSTIPMAEKPSGFVLSQDGQRILVSHPEKLVHWNVASEPPQPLETVNEAWQSLLPLNAGTDECLATLKNTTLSAIWSFEKQLVKAKDLPRNTRQITKDQRVLLQEDPEKGLFRLLDASGATLAETGQQFARSEYAASLGTHLATFYPGDQARMWTVRDGAFEPQPGSRLIPTAHCQYYWVKVSLDGTRIAGMCSDNVLRVFQFSDTLLKPLSDFSNGTITRFAWTPDSTTLYLVNDQADLIRWKADGTDPSGRKILNFGYDLGSGLTQHFQVAPNGKLIAFLTPRGLELISLTDPDNPQRTFHDIGETSDTTQYIAFSPGNRFLYYTSQNRFLKRMDLSALNLTSETVINDPTQSMTHFFISQDGQRIATLGNDRIQWWNAQTTPHQLLGSWKTPIPPDLFQLAPDGRHLLVSQLGTACILRLAPPDAKAATPAPAPANWTDLTANAKLTDWDQFVTAGWTLTNGILAADGSSQGWIGTKNEYADFELELEFKLPPKGNSGIFLRAWENGLPTGSDFVEIQLLDNSGYQNLNATQRNGAVFKQVGPNPEPPFRANEWQTLKLSVVGNKVSVTINDVKCVIDAEVTFSRGRGRVGLQHFRTPVEFRNVRIREQ